MKIKRALFVTGICAVIMAAVVLMYSFTVVRNQTATDVVQKRSENPYNHKLIDSVINLLQSGDVVLRTGADITSYMFTQMNTQVKTYSHCGIVVVEQGYPFVYHAIGGEDNPDQKLRRDSAKFWFSPANNLGLGISRFNLDSDKREYLAKTVQRYFHEQRKFDMSFDLKTDDRLYCAEFVYKAFNEAMNEDQFIRPSTLFGYTFVAVDNLFLNSRARFICQVRYK